MSNEQLKREIAFLKRRRAIEEERKRLLRERHELKQSPIVRGVTSFGKRLTGDIYNYMNRPMPKRKKGKKQITTFDFNFNPNF